MNIYERLVKQVRDFCAIPQRNRIKANMRSRLVNTDFTLISSNCNGAILTHDLGLAFKSPTVNLFFTAPDFVKFCKNLDFYLTLVPQCDEAMSKEKRYPVCKLGDIVLYGVHYKDGIEFIDAWQRRKARVNKDNIFLCMTDRNDCTDELIDQYAQLPYKKVLFSHKPMPQYSFVVYVPEFSSKREVGQLQFFADFKGNRYYEKYFDWIEWLNG